MLRIRRPYYHTTLALQAPPRHNPAMTNPIYTNGVNFGFSQIGANLANYRGPKRS